MKVSGASLWVLLSAFQRLGSTRATKTNGTCVEPQGIVPDGGDGFLNLTFLLSPEEGLGKPLAPLNIFSNPVIPTVSDCGSRFALSVWFHRSLTLLLSLLLDRRRQGIVMC